MGKTLLITGATGFVGRNLILSLLSDTTYETIYLPVRSRRKLAAQLVEEGIPSLPPRFQPYDADADDWKIDDKKIDHVVHCAGLLMGETWQDYVRANIAGTASLLGKVKAAERIVVLSSQAAAGPTPNGTDARSEDQVETPVNFYGRSKLEMEKLIASQFASLPVVVLRPPMVLGPRDNATLALFKMARSPLRMKVGRRPKYYSYIAVQDLVAAILAVLRVPALPTPLPASFFVCSSQVITDGELIAGAGETLGIKGVTLSVPHFAILGLSKMLHPFAGLRAAVPNLSKHRVSEMIPPRWVSSPTRFEHAFAWKAQTALAQTLKETAAWYQQVGLIPK